MERQAFAATLGALARGACVRGVLFASVSVRAQVPSPTAAIESKPLEFAEVIAVDGALKNESLERRARVVRWGIKEREAVLEVQDREGGRLIVKAAAPYEPVTFLGRSRMRGSIGYSVTIQEKDGRYRHTGDFTSEGTSGFGPLRTVSFGAVTTDTASPATARRAVARKGGRTRGSSTRRKRISLSRHSRGAGATRRTRARSG